MHSLAALLAWLCFARDIDPGAIVPHSALNPTSCPGRFLTAALPWLRWLVAWRLHALGRRVEWPGATRTAYVFLQRRPLLALPPPPPPRERVVVEGNELAADPPPLVKDNMSVAPLPALADALGQVVLFDAPSRTAAVVTPYPVTKAGGGAGSCTRVRR